MAQTSEETGASALCGRMVAIHDSMFSITFFINRRSFVIVGLSFVASPENRPLFADGLISRSSRSLADWIKRDRRLMLQI
jgi:hypothetical protein